jgi:Ala-tRNA(Pro) deacylase
MSLPRWLAEILAHYGVAHCEHTHLPAYSANQLAHAEHVTGHRVVKPVFLARSGKPVMVVIPASGRVDLARVRAVVGADVRLASEDEIAGWFKGCRPGCVPPLRLRSDLVVLMERSMAHFGQILFAAGSHEVALSMSFRDWYRIVRPGVGRFAQFEGKTADRKPLVLVVEDESDTNDLLCQYLEGKGYACRGAGNGKHALELARTLRPSAILLDLMLPDMCGLDMYESLRQVGPMRLPPAVVVTALDDDALRQRGRDLGADAYLTKPFFPDALMRELQEVMADAV